MRWARCCTQLSISTDVSPVAVSGHRTGGGGLPTAARSLSCRPPPFQASQGRGLATLNNPLLSAPGPGPYIQPPKRPLPLLRPLLRLPTSQWCKTQDTAYHPQDLAGRDKKYKVQLGLCLCWLIYS